MRVETVLGGRAGSVSQEHIWAVMARALKYYMEREEPAFRLESRLRNAVRTLVMNDNLNALTLFTAYRRSRAQLIRSQLTSWSFSFVVSQTGGWDTLIFERAEYVSDLGVVPFTVELGVNEKHVRAALVATEKFFEPNYPGYAFMGDLSLWTVQSGPVSARGMNAYFLPVSSTPRAAFEARV
ncbi:MAG: hypothetical protein U0136_14040 [Bdellovibrionota bacterium]